MTKTSSHRLVGSLVTLGLLLAASCSFKDFDSLQSGSVGGDNGKGGQDNGGAGGDTGGNTGTGGNIGTGGTTETGGATSTGGTTGAASTVVVPNLGPWEFADKFSSPMTDTTWQVNSMKTAYMDASWIALGESDSGSMKLVVHAANATDPITADILSEVISNTPGNAQVDLTHCLMNFRIRTESGATQIKPYAFGYDATTKQTLWADTGMQDVNSTWSTVSLNFDFDKPSEYLPVGYTPTAVTAYGFQTIIPKDSPTGTTVTLYVDRIWLEAAP
jgi:hypothetical protein